MADVSQYVILAATIVSLASATVTTMNTAFDAYQSSNLFPKRIGLLQQEVGALRGVVDECYTTVTQGPVQAPDHVKALLVACFEQGREVDELLEKAVDTRRRMTSTVLSRLRMVTFILSPRGRELDTTVAVLRNKVGILRDECSE
jgi:hypothetical protein